MIPSTGLRAGGGTTTGLAGSAADERPDENARQTELFERVLERIYRYFHSLITEAAEADECAQRTLLVLETSIRDRTYDPTRSFNTWMWMKAHATFVEWCRERGKRLEPLNDALLNDALPIAAPASADACADAEAELDAATVLGEIERRLGTETYEVFVLRYHGGLKLEEVADAVGRDRKTVSVRLKAAQALVERLLGEGGSR